MGFGGESMTKISSDFCEDGALMNVLSNAEYDVKFQRNKHFFLSSSSWIPALFLNKYSPR